MFSKSRNGTYIRLNGNKWIDPIFKKFNRNIYKYIDAVGCTNDLPYYYNERTTISVLSGAAWKSGMVCLQDYATLKNDPTRKGPSTKLGWGDLYVYCSKTKKEAAFEAKQIFPKIDSHNTSITNTKLFSSFLDKAIFDAEQVRDTKKRFATLFVTPRFPVDKWQNNLPNMNEKVTGLIDESHRYALAHSIDMFTWCFPKSAVENSFSSRSKNTKEYYYAGVMAFIINI